jgi:hypothetical protein
MTPHYDRLPQRVGAANQPPSALGTGPDDEAMEEAAEALRQVEVEAALPDVSTLDASQLENMSIDELRALASALDVPDRAQITEQDDLIAAIRRALP